VLQAPPGRSRFPREASARSKSAPFHANRRAKQRRREEPGLEFEIDFASLTDDERDEFVALINERAAHREERLEAIQAQVGALKALLRLLISSDAPPRATLAEALDASHISLVEVVESIRGAVPDPLAE
jgi:hypothetical protein